MAHLLPSYSFVSTNPWKRNTSNNPTSNCRRSLNRASRTSFPTSSPPVRCCSTSSPAATSSPEAVKLIGDIDQEEIGRTTEDRAEADQLVYLLSEYGWNVRRLLEDEVEMRKVAQIQAEAFHQPAAIFDDLFFEFFQVEVLSGLIYKLRNSPPSRYACLVAESPTDASDSRRKLVGVVDVTALRDEVVLRHLQGAEEYLYVSGLAVSKSYRRRKIASSLLKACDVLAFLWGFQCLALRVYEDDLGARRLYTNAGYQAVSGDPPWMTSWIGRKRRLLMIKRCNFL
ncbi:hypothetical protein SLEP1_g9185 [Rubroshorea leprosula]|uniref:N-acetyltransferase domain-containing protein n=1 Tax=Rubroshorea leprosula TaxID=152421 RepID=A0AAV5I447_9ROSI|nr:hypothetical protein SLEP1_g9185 [Rubroshorea leprosula]